MTAFRVKIFIYTVIAAAAAVFLHIFEHECGHLLVMLGAGSTITEFSVLHAHVSGVGGSFTLITELLFNVSGALLPYLLGLLTIALYRRKAKNHFYRIFVFLRTLIAASSLMSWVIIPVQYMHSRAPRTDDVTKFLDLTADKIHPLIISNTAVCLILVMIICMFLRDISRNYVLTIKSLRL